MDFTLSGLKNTGRGGAGWVAWARAGLFTVGPYLAAGLVLGLLTNLTGLPAGPKQGLMSRVGRPDGWPLFIGALIPLGLLLNSLVYKFLGRWATRHDHRPALHQAVARGGRYVDCLAFGVLFAVAALVVAHKWVAQWALLVGAFYLLGVFAVAALAGSLLWRMECPAAETDNRIASRGTFLLVAAMYCALTFWTVQAVSTCGDEPGYLFSAKLVLTKVGAVDAADPAAAKSRRDFYWGRWSQSLAEPSFKRSPLFPVLLAPFVVLAGRVGALWALSLILALSLTYLFRTSLALGYGRRPSLVMVWMLALCSPFAQLGQHVYPAALGVFATSAALFHLVREPGGVGRWSALKILGLALLAALAKFRFMPLSLGICLCLAVEGAGRWLTRRTRARLVFILVFAPLLGILFIYWSQVYLALHGIGLDILPSQLQTTLDAMFKNFSGIVAILPAIFLDQEYGLLAYAPWLVVGLLCVGRFHGSSPRVTAYSFLMAFYTVTAVLGWRYMQWYGGFTPPGRFFFVFLPLLALFALPGLNLRLGSLWNGQLAAIGTCSVGLFFVFSLVPQWRFHRATGVNNLLQVLGDKLDIPLNGLFPSFINAMPLEMAPAILWGGLILLAAYYFHLLRENDAARPPSCRRLVLSWTAACLVLVLLAVGLFAAAKRLPTTHFQGAAMKHKRMSIHGDSYPESRYLVFGRRWDVASKQVIMGNRTELLVLYAEYVEVNRGKPVKRSGPAVISVFFNRRYAGDVVVGEDYGPYKLDIKIPPGPAEIKLMYAKQPAPHDQILLDRVDLTGKPY